MRLLFDLIFLCRNLLINYCCKIFLSERKKPSSFTECGYIIARAFSFLQHFRQYRTRATLFCDICYFQHNWTIDFSGAKQMSSDISILQGIGTTCPNHTSVSRKLFFNHQRISIFHRGFRVFFAIFSRNLADSWRLL